MKLSVKYQRGKTDSRIASLMRRTISVANVTLELSDSYQVNNQERTCILTMTKSYFQLFWDNGLVLLIRLCPATG